jgi:hypothetical protein
VRETRRAGPSGFVYLLAAALALAAGAARPAAAQELPGRMIAFFTGLQACPPGWIESPNAAGRLVVGVRLGHTVGGTVGLPLGEKEDRKHRHPFTAQFRVPAKSLTAVDGCCNECCANYGTRTSQGEPITGDSTSNLPFIQLLLCEKLEKP